jgi:hypothetical protein
LSAWQQSLLLQKNKKNVNEQATAIPPTGMAVLFEKAPPSILLFLPVQL